MWILQRRIGVNLDGLGQVEQNGVAHRVLQDLPRNIEDKWTTCEGRGMGRADQQSAKSLCRFAIKGTPTKGRARKDRVKIFTKGAMGFAIYRSMKNEIAVAQQLEGEFFGSGGR
jgi:hypothetical protein